MILPERHERSTIMKKTRLFFVAAAVLSAALLSGCASTKIIDSWRDEAYTGRPTRMLVLAVAKERPSWLHATSHTSSPCPASTVA